VADNGKGIDAGPLPRIRDVFVQGQVLSRAKGGLGIGLAVVKSLVERQHGTVAVASGGPARAARRGQRRPARHDVRAAAVARLHGDDGGRAALALAERQRPDVAFVDIDLPDISGYEVARQLARRGGIRLVAVTGYGQPEDVRRALAAGFDVHLKKPVRLDELERTLGAAGLVR
jgi:CheY-like chemotaxis protein